MKHEMVVTVCSETGEPRKRLKHEMVVTVCSETGEPRKRRWFNVIDKGHYKSIGRIIISTKDQT